MTRFWLRHLTRVFLALPAAVAAQESRSIEVRLQLVDSAGQPIAGAPVRVVLALGEGWQSPNAGLKAITGGAGEVAWTLAATPEVRRRKLPSNFVTHTLAPVENTTHLAIGVELAYLGQAWLVVGAGDRFGNGTTAQLDGVRIYGRDETGSFSRPAVQRGGAWYLPGVPGALTTPGFAAQRLAIAPAERGWTVDFVLQRANEPVAR
jgi:hypothetical protein